MRFLILPVLMLAMVAVVGCRLERPGPPPDPVLLEPDPTFEVPEPMGVDSLREQVQMFGSLVREFPARGETEHYAMVRQALSDLLVILPTLRGGEVDGAFLQQMRSMDRVRWQLRPEGDFMPTDATVTMGLRSAYNALIATAVGEFAEDEVVGEELARMRQRIEELDRVRGPIHRLVSGQALRHGADVVHRMTMMVVEDVEAADELAGEG